MLSYEPVLSHCYARFWNTSLLHMLYLVMRGPNNNVLMRGCTLMKSWLEENFLKPQSSKLWAWTMPVLAHGILLDNSGWTSQLSYDFFNVIGLTELYLNVNAQDDHVKWTSVRIDILGDWHVQTLHWRHVDFETSGRCMDQYQFERLHGL